MYGKQPSRYFGYEMKKELVKIYCKKEEKFIAPCQPPRPLKNH